MKAFAGIKQAILSTAILLILILAAGVPALAGISPSPNALNFAAQTVNTSSAPMTVTITNTGNRVTIATVMSSSGSFVYSGPALPLTLARGASFTAKIIFTPTAAQSYGRALTVTRNNGSAITVPLSGTGTWPAAQAPSITTQPVTKTVTTGQTATFSISATGTNPLTYQWSKNGAAINGATLSSYTTAATTSSDNGALFAVLVSNSAGSVTSSAATLNVTAAAVAPSISTQPVSKTVSTGQTATFTVAATGTAPMSYQWKKAGALIAGATSSMYTTPATSTTDNGTQYTVVVSNSAGSATSTPATLTVNSTAVAPTITGQPASRSIATGQNATFSVAATGTAPLTFQWSKNGAAIAGATSSTYTAPLAVISDNGALFTATATNSAGSATSSAATLSVRVASLTLTASPSSISFGSVSMPNSTMKSVTLTNTGDNNINISNVSMSGSGFTASGVPAGTILTIGQSTTFNVTFTPSAAGSATGSVAVMSNATGSPTVSTLSGTGMASHSVELSWTASTSPVLGYNAYSATVSGGPYTKLTSTPAPGTSFTDSTVQSGTSYYYVVTAVDSTNNESVLSGEVSAIIP